MTEKNKTKEKSYNDIWKELYDYDVSSYADKKDMGWGDAEYLSWGVAHTILMKMYGSDYSWDRVMYNDMPYKLLQNGTGEVGTTITIHGHTRSFWLPVMDFKGSSTTNLDAKTVNNNIMRCFVKNASVGFGLGMSLYSQIKEDIVDYGKKPEKQQGKTLSEPTVPLAPKNKSSSENNKETLTPYEDGYPTDEVDVTESEMFLKATDSYLNADNLTVEELGNFYKQNKDKFDKLKKELPKYYKVIIEKFTSVKKTLEEK